MLPKKMTELPSISSNVRDEIAEKPPVNQLLRNAG